MLKPKRVNQITIARTLGVSRATVSLVLRGGKGASQKTAKKVLNMARKMGYRPNALVHGIRSGKSRTIGVLVPPHDTHWQAVCHGIHDRLLEANHLPLFLWDNEQQPDFEARALDQINRLLDRWVDGVITWPHFSPHYFKHLPEFQVRDIPLAIIDHTASGLHADTVNSDEPQLARLIVSHLAALGHRHFLNIPGPQGLGWADTRSAAVLKQLETVSGSRVTTARPADGDDFTVTVSEALRGDPAITAVICGTDNLARCVYRAARDLGLSIPGQLSVSGTGNLNFSADLTPPLTTINQNGYAMGRQAAQIILERGAGILSGAPRHYTIPVSLVERGSTSHQ